MSNKWTEGPRVGPNSADCVAQLDQHLAESGDRILTDVLAEFGQTLPARDTTWPSLVKGGWIFRSAARVNQNVTEVGQVGQLRPVCLRSLTNLGQFGLSRPTRQLLGDFWTTVELAAIVKGNCSGRLTDNCSATLLKHDCLRYYRRLHGRRNFGRPSLLTLSRSQATPQIDARRGQTPTALFHADGDKSATASATADLRADAGCGGGRQDFANTMLGRMALREPSYTPPKSRKGCISTPPNPTSLQEQPHNPQPGTTPNRTGT